MWTQRKVIVVMLEKLTMVKFGSTSMLQTLTCPETTPLNAAAGCRLFSCVQWPRYRTCFLDQVREVTWEDRGKSNL